MSKEKSKERDRVTEIPEFTLKVSIQIIFYYFDSTGNRRNKNEYEKEKHGPFCKPKNYFSFC